MHRRLLGTGLVLVASSPVAVGCSILDSFPAYPDAGAYADRADGFVDARGDAQGCDATKTPSEEPCVVTEEYGIFVAPTIDGGSDTTGVGTRNLPYATLMRGIAVAKARGKRVYACSGSYSESVVFDEHYDGVNLYGGLACPRGTPDARSAPWSYTGDPAVDVSSGTALSVIGLSKGTTIEDLEFDSVATKPGVSSIAALLLQSTGVVLRRVALKAGPGMTGPSGKTESNHSGAAPGGDSSDGDAGGGASNSCRDGTISHGGPGAPGGGGGPFGMGGSGTSMPATNTPRTAPYDGIGGADNDPMHGGQCDPGDPGANGATQSTPAAGAGEWGALTSSGWHPADGAQGGNGDPGQGGGGGGASQAGTGGGGGGPGGCGGGAGMPGGGGGSSFGLLSFEAFVSLHDCALQTADGAEGGTGGTGQPGQGGGVPGSGFKSACAGGTGGNGAGGGGGGGGAGGVSVGIGYVGQRPSVDDATSSAIKLGTSGAAGKGGIGGPGGGSASGNPGSAGLAGRPGTAGTAAAMLELPSH